jgi:hypothetical protein
MMYQPGTRNRQSSVARAFWAGVALLPLVHSAHAAPACNALGYNNVPAAKPNKLFLYFPATDDQTFPEFATLGAPATSPARMFDTSQLTSYPVTATSAQLQNAIFDVVTDDYCEFNVQVIQVAAQPPNSIPRGNIIAIGTDSGFGTTDINYGATRFVDTGDVNAVDYGRVWAGTYQAADGASGGVLEGPTNSTVERWANAIGGTAAHEAGHNYGLVHELSALPGEDALVRHLMPDGNTFTSEQRVGFRRHFSDQDFSVLAANVGLSIQTMYNWDLVNLNAGVASGLRMEFLSTQPSLTLASVYTGSRSPWTTPVVSAPMGTQTFKNVTYNRYRITWSAGQSWIGGMPGQVLGGGRFHVGASFVGVDFNTPDPIIVIDVTLLDSTQQPLPLHPRIPGFDAGTLDSASGTFSVSAFNFQAAPMAIERVNTQFLPRWASIDSMISSAERVSDPFGLPITQWPRKKLVEIERTTIRREGTMRIPLARLRDGRNIMKRIGPRECGIADRRGNNSERDALECVPGISVDLFPATSTLIVATVVDPRARHWNPTREAYEVGEIRSTVYYQLLGRRPDLDRNGVDDTIDIATGKARDANRDGVIDRVQRRPN